MSGYLVFAACFIVVTWLDTYRVSRLREAIDRNEQWVYALDRRLKKIENHPWMKGQIDGN